MHIHAGVLTCCGLDATTGHGVIALSSPRTPTVERSCRVCALAEAAVFFWLLALIHI
jgi:hypothetical protein